METNLQSQKEGEGLFSNRDSDTRDPRQQGILRMATSVLCPNLTLKSFTFVVVTMCVVCFVLQLIIDGVKLPGAFLEVQYL